MSIKLFESQNSSPSYPSTLYAWYEYTPAGIPPPRDGCWGFSVGGNDYITIGWNSPNITYNSVYRSTDNGNSWTQLSNAPFSGRHTVASYNLPTQAYLVGGDYFNFSVGGQYAKDSWVYNGTTWTQKAANSGIGDRILMGATYHNGAFYIVGGQVSRYIIDGEYNNVLRSTDNCVSFQEIATTPFPGGNLWGAVASFKGKMWKVCGGFYDDVPPLSARTYPREIYSSNDGITWTYEGMFPGQGRQYHQTIVWKDLLWVIGGVNTTNSPNTINLRDTWYSPNGVDWTQLPIGTFVGLHAHTCWIGADGNLHSFGGSTNPGTTETNKYFVLKNIITP